MIVSFLPFCKSCYLQCTSGKMSSIVLRDNLGTATYDLAVQRIVFPPAVPASRVPVPGKKGKGKAKALVLTTLPLAMATMSFSSPSGIAAGKERGPLREQDVSRLEPSTLSNGDRFSQREGELGLA